MGKARGYAMASREGSARKRGSSNEGRWGEEKRSWAREGRISDKASRFRLCIIATTLAAKISNGRAQIRGHTLGPDPAHGQLRGVSVGLLARVLEVAWRRGVGVALLSQGTRRVDVDVVPEFGGFAPETWEPRHKFFGTPEAFVFSFSNTSAEPEADVFTWTSSNNYFMYCDQNLLAMGGGDGRHAIAIRSDLLRGTSAPTSTFGISSGGRASPVE